MYKRIALKNKYSTILKKCCKFHKVVKLFLSFDMRFEIIKF